MFLYPGPGTGDRVMVVITNIFLAFSAFQASRSRLPFKRHCGTINNRLKS